MYNQFREGRNLTAEGWEKAAEIQEELASNARAAARALREHGRESLEFREASMTNRNLAVKLAKLVELL